MDAIVIGPKFPLRHLARLRRQKTFTTGARGVGTITLRPWAADGAVFSDVFRGREYDMSRFPQYQAVVRSYQDILAADRTPVIIDCGANVGATSIWFAQHFQRARILAVEPDADNARMCRVNTHSFVNIHVLEAAIGSSCGSVSLQNVGHGAPTVAVQTRRCADGVIEVVTIGKLMADVGASAQIFIVKVDIEGFEADLFLDNLDWLDRVTAVFIEPHDWMLPGRCTSANFQRAFASRCFELLVIGQNLAYVRASPRVDHHDP